MQCAPNLCRVKNDLLYTNNCEYEVGGSKVTGLEWTRKRDFGHFNCDKAEILSKSFASSYLLPASVNKFFSHLTLVCRPVP